MLGDADTVVVKPICAGVTLDHGPILWEPANTEDFECFFSQRFELLPLPLHLGERCHRSFQEDRPEVGLQHAPWAWAVEESLTYTKAK